MGTPILFTIGYSRMDKDTFLLKLHQARVNLLLDVRERAFSRNPKFSRKSLEKAVTDAGIQYRHFPQLGVPSALRKRLGSRISLRAYFRAYTIHLNQQDHALKELYELVTRRRACLLCLESDPAKCHRSVLAQRLASMDGQELQVCHI